MSICGNKLCRVPGGVWFLQGVFGGASLKDMQANRFKGSFVSSGTTGGDIGQKPLIVAAKQPASQQSLPPPPASFLRKPGPSAAESATAAAVSCPSLMLPAMRARLSFYVL